MGKFQEVISRIRKFIVGTLLFFKKTTRETRIELRKAKEEYNRQAEQIEKLLPIPPEPAIYKRERVYVKYHKPKRTREYQEKEKEDSDDLGLNDFGKDTFDDRINF